MFKPRIYPRTHYGRFYEIAEGVIVPSATTMCRYGNPIAHSTLLYMIKQSEGSVDVFYNKKTQALIDGNVVHQGIEDYEEGMLVDFENESNEAKKGMISYVAWREKYQPKIISQEEMLFCSKVMKGKLVYPFAGRCDMVAEIDGEIWMLDAKTSLNHKDHNYMYQLSMYKMLWDENHPEQKIDRLGIIRCIKNFNGSAPSPRTELLYEMDYNPDAVGHLVFQFNMFYEQYDKEGKPKRKPRLETQFQKASNEKVS
tara:strand:- start:1282 stop:2046 length:765 start_codon:yes stop_codon:yes gene_type:complete